MDNNENMKILAEFNITSEMANLGRFQRKAGDRQLMLWYNKGSWTEHFCNALLPLFEKLLANRHTFWVAKFFDSHYLNKPNIRVRKITKTVQVFQPFC